MRAVMYVRLMLVVLLTSSSQAVISSEKINADADEIIRLTKELKSSSPAILHRNQLLVCEMINQCCPFMKPRLADYLGNPHTGSIELMNGCIGNIFSPSILNECPTVEKFTSVVLDPDFLKYANAFLTVTTKIRVPPIHVPVMCSADETYAVLCDSTKLQEMESCQRKTLHYVLEHSNDTVYQTFVRRSKNNLGHFISAIKKAFPMMNTTEAATSSTLMNTKTPRSPSLFSTQKNTITPSNTSQRPIWTIMTLINLLLAMLLPLI